MKKNFAAAGALALAGIGTAVFGVANASATSETNHFTMERSPAIVAANCLPNARADVTIRNDGATEVMQVKASGLPKNTDFDLFVTQVPNTPFGVAWYQGDLESNDKGKAFQQYRGRFSIETFAIALNTAPAPSVHSTPTPDATTNPPFGPIHTFHLGLWFNSPADAAAAGCPGATTPFNGEHNAGVQLLNTDAFADTAGPLKNLG